MKLLLSVGNGKIPLNYVPGRSLLPGTALNTMVFSRGLLLCRWMSKYAEGFFSWNKNGFVQNYIIKSCLQEMLIQLEGFEGWLMFPTVTAHYLNIQNKVPVEHNQTVTGLSCQFKHFMYAYNRKTNKQKPSCAEFLMLQHWSKFTLFLSKWTVKVLCLNMLMSLLTWSVFCLQGSSVS